MVETDELTLAEAEPIGLDEDGRPADGKGSKNSRGHLDLGKRGEEAAIRYLKRRGYDVLVQGFRCKAGEADIIARTEDCLCFIEVKTRRGTSKGFPEEAVDARKRDRYERIAAYYLKDHVREELCVRFDVISIIVLSENHAFLRFHKNAYGVDW